MKYILERNESVLRRLLPPDAMSVAQVSEQEGISHATLFNWRNAARNEGQLMPDSKGPADKWLPEVKFTVVLESASMNETELAEYCRKRGVNPGQVALWKEACKTANTVPSKAHRRGGQADTRSDQKKINQLEKELQRKEKALAETAALLVLRKKKANAIWGSGEDE